MGDFHQNGLVTTLHNLSRRPVEDLEKELLSFSSTRPMSLVLPCLYSELQGPAQFLGPPWGGGLPDLLTQGRALL